MKTMDYYVIRAISNLHVGSGEGDFSVIDKQVQRDQITQLPIIHASGIKGALREAMEYKARGISTPQANSGQTDPVTTVFGGSPKDRKKIQQGQYNFFDGKLLALPSRSSHDFFYLATCEALLSDAILHIEQFAPENRYLKPLKKLKSKAENTPIYFGENNGDIILEEEWTITHSNYDLGILKDFFGERLALLKNNHIHQLAKELPIIARNYLENGISNNLWYEEIVPREARFLTMVSREDGNNHLNDFLEEKTFTVQLGANATVGYGLCTLKKIN